MFSCCLFCNSLSICMFLLCTSLLYFFNLVLPYGVIKNDKSRLSGSSSRRQSFTEIYVSSPEVAPSTLATFSSCHSPVTLNSDLYLDLERQLDSVKMNYRQHAKYTGQRSSRSEVIVMRQTHIYRLITGCGPLKWVSNSSSSSSSECLVSVTMTSISGKDDATLYTSAALLMTQTVLQSVRSSTPSSLIHRR